MKDPYKNKKLPRLTVDTFVRDRKGRVLLVRRGRPPFKGRWGLPGGFCEWRETTEACGARETLEETGVRVKIARLLGVYSKPDRDPRGHNVTVLYEGRPVSGKAQGGDDAAEARWFTPRELERLSYAFDHSKIIREQLARLTRAARQPARSARRRAALPSRRGRLAGARG
jgi:8-oxo-dGTP diphosphatase